VPNTWVKFIKALHALSGMSRAALYIVIALIFIFHIVLSFCNKDFTWLAAFGALLSVFGLLMSFSYSFPLEEINEGDLNPTKEGDHYVDGGMEFGELITSTEEIDKIKNSKVSGILKNYENISIYFIFTVSGTLLWAYAGFLNNVFFQ
jgi:hypothetical protein